MLVGGFLQILFKFCIKSTTKNVLPHLLGPPTKILKFSKNRMSDISILEILSVLIQSLLNFTIILGKMQNNESLHHCYFHHNHFK